MPSVRSPFDGGSGGLCSSDPNVLIDEEVIATLLRDEPLPPHFERPAQAALPLRCLSGALLFAAAACAAVVLLASRSAALGDHGGPPTSLSGENAVTQDFAQMAGGSGEALGIIGRYGLTGVSLGGWLCLEDWFFSMGKGNRVASIHQQGQGYALPPRIDSMSTPWTSEGLMTQRLIEDHGRFFAIKAITDYRTEFMSSEDLREIAALGLKLVRLPVTWAAFADALAPLDQATYGSHNPDLDIITVPDPFYKDKASFVTIPRRVLTDFLRQAKANGLRVVLDIHAFPGGASHGTYNGVWPERCAFWMEKSQIGLDKDLTEVGLWIVDKMFKWIETLDFETQGALAGITLMNEPGHMNRWKQFANEEVILDWLQKGSDMFLRSGLPLLGMKLYMNLVETAFHDFDGVVVPWYRKSFSLEERRTRVVADVHYYMAWDYHICDGRSDGFGAYKCSADPGYQGKVRGCAQGNAKNMHRRWNENNELVAVSEFSLGTYEMPDIACKEPDVLETMLKEQLAAFAKYNFETIIWTWKMPYARDFWPGWSLQWLVAQHQERKQ